MEEIDISPRILVVDDEARMCTSIKRLLVPEGYRVETSTRAPEALRLIDSRRFDVFLLDLFMPVMDGFGILDHIHRQDPGAPVVMITGSASVETAVKALKSGAYDYLIKPVEPRELLRTLGHALEKRSLMRENRNIQERLEASERKFRFLVQNSPDLIYTLDHRGRFTFVNSGFEKLLGYPCRELIGKTYETIVFQEDREKARWLFNERRTKERATHGAELRLAFAQDAAKFRQCEVQHLTIELKATGVYSRAAATPYGRFLGTHGVARDVSYRKYLEYQLRQAQKMEAIGTLAGGIAHDFNNLLMGIQGYTSLMLASLEPNHPHYAKLQSIEDHVQSGSRLTRQLLGFAREGKFEVRVVDLRALLEKSAGMFARTKKELRLRTQIQPDTWPVEADAGQIQQVLLNLLVNAWQSMPGGGEIFLQTRNVTLMGDAAEGKRLKPGPYIEISVTDTGLGMSEELRQRIFEPFFTTKERGRGTGLGLASSYGIVVNHGGTIEVLSQPGAGSTFVVFLPATRKPLNLEPAAPSGVPGGRETVLLVDDEESVIAATAGMLRRLGYHVLTARSGEEAVAALGEHRGRIDIVILDLVMPAMDGAKTCQAIKSIEPGVRVLLSSGYNLADAGGEGILAGVDGFIQKPFDIRQLSQKLHHILRAPGAQTG
jgi:PAS domain S-box-containing protein